MPEPMIAERDAQAMPPIDAATLVRWRGMLATLAETMGMCDGRIWSVSSAGAEVLIAHGSPLPGEGMRVAATGSRLLFQEVARERSTLDVASPQWSGSSNAAQGIRDYLGLPILWPDKSVFGVIEVFTDEHRSFTSLHRRLATQVRDNIEDQLRTLAVVAEQARTTAERRLLREVGLLAAEAADFGAWDYQIDADVLQGDPAWRRLLWLDGTETVATLDAFKRLIHPDDRSLVTDAGLLGLVEPADATPLTFRLVRPDGQTRWVRSAARVLDGAQARSIGVLVDVTASHAADDALRQGRTALLEAEAVIKDIRERLLLAAGTSRLGIWEFDIAAGALQGDASLCAIFGMEPGELNTPMAFLGRVHSQDRKLLDFAVLARRAHDPDHQELQFRIVRPTGEIRYVSCTMQLSEPSPILPRRLRGVVVDVTEPHQTTEALNRNKASLQYTEKLVRLANWRFDRATQQFFASDMLYELNDSDPDAPTLTQADLEQLLSPQSQDGATNAIQHCLRTGQPYALDVHYLRPDGTSFLANVRGRAERDASGAIIGVVGTLQDMSEREQANARVAALAQALPQGAIYSFEWTDGHFALIEASEGIETLIGVSSAVLRADREAFIKIMAKSERRYYLAEFERARQAGAVFDCRFNVVRPDGTTAWLQSRAVPRTRPDGTVVWDGILRDIATERQSSAALRQAAQTMVAMDRAKDDLLTVMSQDMRSPMNTLVGMTRLALQTELAPKQRNYLDRIDTAARSLQAIVGDVLDYSRIDAGRLQLENGEFTLQSVLDAVSAAAAPLAEDKGLEIAFAIDADVPADLRGDLLRVSQVLSALVTSAVRFTETGEVVLSVDRMPAADGASVLEFEVRDTGIGLDADQIAGLFRPFDGDASRTSPRHGGSGLAFSVCKRLVEQMGGTMVVESQPGRDTTFRFTVALQSVQSKQDTKASAFANRRVLIVDDNATARTILADMADDLGLAPQTVASGAEALAAIAKAAQGAEQIELVLIDWRMPGMDGLDLARRLRDDITLGELPIVLMATGHGREDMLRRADQLGLQGVLAKPITPYALRHALDAIFAPTGTRARTGLLPTAGDEARLAKAALTDRRVLMIDDDATARQAITDLLELAGVTVDTAASSGEALERLARCAYDVVVMDMQMSGMAAREITRRIRRNPSWTRLPIVALTAEEWLDDQVGTRKTGITAQLIKPVGEIRLYRALAEIFAGTRPVASVVPPDFDVALRRLNGDKHRLERLMRGFMRDFADIPAKLGNLIGTDDLPETGALALLVKAAASTLEAHQLVAAATELEQAARNGDRAVDTLALEFRKHLQAVLDAIGTRLALEALPVSGASGRDRETALALIATVEPLVARGDNAADTMLKQLSVLLDGKVETAMIEAVRSAYEDVKLPTALAGLARLKAGLVHG